jgi:hypothetical protein
MWYIILSRSLPDKEESKQNIMKSTANGWTISTARDGCSFPDRLPIAPMESTSCSHRARTKRSASPLKSRTM